MKWLNSLLVSLTILSGVYAAPPTTSTKFEPAENETPEGLAQKSMSAGYCQKIEVRREWRTFTKAQKEAYIAAVNCLANVPHDNRLVAQYPRPNLVPINSNSSLYDDMSYIHMDQTDKTHYTGFFLPWHRWFVSEHVRQLRSKCNYKGVMPYWDWTLDAEDPPSSPIFNGAGAKDNFGSATGDPNNDYYLFNGGLKDMIVSYPIKRKIRRQYTPYPYLTWWWLPRPWEHATVPLQKERVLAAILGHRGDFIGFQNATEQPQSFHPNVHMMMGGDLAGFCPQAAGPGCQGGPTWTPNDPLFYLHHAMMDRIWFLWQLVHPSNFWAFAGGSIATYTDPAFPNGYPPWLTPEDRLGTSGLFESLKIKDVINPVSPTAGCYIYI